MSDVWWPNASPLITLAKAGHLDLLTWPDIEVMVPQAVAAEVLAGPPVDPARVALEAGWGQRAPTIAVPEVILEWGLGRGESEVIALASARPGSVALLDDAAARMCARSLRLPVMGTVGVVMRARRLGRVPAAAGIIRALRHAGLYLDDHVIAAALASVGESWPPA
ncbi:MAG TPA: DUF3368 domain-containing protein [Polyangia bacterium]